MTELVASVVILWDFADEKKNLKIIGAQALARIQRFMLSAMIPILYPHIPLK